MDGPALERAARLTDRVWIFVSRDRRSAQTLRRVEQSLAEQRVLSLRYRDRHDKESQRRVDPVLLARTDGNWFLVAFSRSAEAIRWFRFERIETATLTNEPAFDVPVESVGRPPSSAQPVSDL